jgi:hypothetical protein
VRPVMKRSAEVSMRERAKPSASPEGQIGEDMLCATVPYRPLSKT